MIKLLNDVCFDHNAADIYEEILVLMAMKFHVSKDALVYRAEFQAHLSRQEVIGCQWCARIYRKAACTSLALSIMS
jgi:hypothetical protein